MSTFKKYITKLFDPRPWEICLGTKNLERYLTQALREDVYEIVPFIFGLANETFEAQKISKLSVLPGRGSDGSNFTPETALNNLQKEGKSQFFLKRLDMDFQIFAKWAAQCSMGAKLQL